MRNMVLLIGNNKGTNQPVLAQFDQYRVEDGIAIHDVKF